MTEGFTGIKGTEHFLTTVLNTTFTYRCQACNSYAILIDNEVNASLNPLQVFIFSSFIAGITLYATFPISILHN